MGGVTTIGIRELNHRTGALVRAAAGQRIVVTDHGRPVADLVPHGSDEARRRREAEVTASINAMLALVAHDEERDLATASDDVLGDVEW